MVQGGYAGGTNIITADPMLGTLGNYGGSTQTIPLQPSSSAIDAGNATYCPVTDQRGQARDDLQCDIGAYELKYADSPTVIRTVSSVTMTTFGPALVGIQRGGGTDPGIVTVTKSLTWQTKPANAIDAYWSITPAVNSGLNLTLMLCYLSAELNGLNESALRFWRYSGGTWTQVGPASLTWTTHQQQPVRLGEQYHGVQRLDVGRCIRANGGYPIQLLSHIPASPDGAAGGNGVGGGECCVASVAQTGNPP